MAGRLQRTLEGAISRRNKVIVVNTVAQFKTFPAPDEMIILPSVGRLLSKLNDDGHWVVENSRAELMKFKESLRMSFTKMQTIKSKTLHVNIRSIGGPELARAIATEPKWAGFLHNREVSLTGCSYLCAGVKRCPDGGCGLIFPKNQQRPCDHHSQVQVVRCNCSRFYWMHSEDLDLQLFWFRDPNRGHSHPMPPPFRLREVDKRQIREAKQTNHQMTPVQLLRETNLAQRNPAANATRVARVMRTVGRREGISPFTLRLLDQECYQEVKTGRQDVVGGSSTFAGKNDEDNLCPYYRRMSDYMGLGLSGMSGVNAVCSFQNPCMSMVAATSLCIVVDAAHKVVKGTKTIPAKNLCENFVAITPTAWGQKGFPVSRHLIFRETRNVYGRCFENFFRTMEDDGHDVLEMIRNHKINFLVDFHYGQILGVPQALLELHYVNDTAEGLRMALGIMKGCNLLHFLKNGLKAVKLCVEEDTAGFRRARTLLDQIPMYEDKKTVRNAFRELEGICGASIISWVNWWQQPIILALLCRAFSLNPNFMLIPDHTNHAESLQTECEEGAIFRSPQDQIKAWFNVDRRHYFQLKNLVEHNVPFRNRVDTLAKRQLVLARRKELRRRRRIDREHKGPDSRRALARRNAPMLADDPDARFDDSEIESDSEEELDEDAYMPQRKEVCDTLILELMEEWKERHPEGTPFLRMMTTFGEVGLDRGLLDEEDEEDDEYDPLGVNPFEVGDDPGSDADSDSDDDLEQLDRVHMTRSRTKPNRIRGDRSDLTKATEPECEIVPEPSARFASDNAEEPQLMFISLHNQTRRVRTQRAESEARARRGAQEAEEARKRRRIDQGTDQDEPKRKKRKFLHIRKRFSPNTSVLVSGIGVGSVVEMRDQMVKVKIEHIFFGVNVRISRHGQVYPADEVFEIQRDLSRDELVAFVEGSSKEEEGGDDEES